MPINPVRWFVVVVIVLVMAFMAFVGWWFPAPVSAQNPQAPLLHVRMLWTEPLTNLQTVSLIKVDQVCYLTFIVYHGNGPSAPALHVQSVACPVP